MKKRFFKKAISLLISSTVIFGSGICVFADEQEEEMPEEAEEVIAEETEVPVEETVIEDTDHDADITEEVFSDENFDEEISDEIFDDETDEYIPVEEPEEIVVEEEISSVILSESITYGWRKNSKGWWYRDSDGTYPKDCWKEISGVYYHFNSAGYLDTNKWIETENGGWFYVDENGKIFVGWKKISGKWYFFSSHYRMTDGNMLTGERYCYDLNYKDSAGYYYFDDNGVMQTGIVELYSRLFYFGTDGKEVKGPRVIEIDGQYYYMDSRGAMLEVDAGSLSGWLRMGEDSFYFDENGEVLTGSQVIDGKHYLFDENGAAYTGWLCDQSGPHDVLYYYGKDGAMVTGWNYITIGFPCDIFSDYGPGNHYYDPYDEGVVACDRWYYFDESGAMQTGTQKIDGRTYNFHGKFGYLSPEGWLCIEDNWYFFKKVHGGVEDDDEYYYRALKGLQQINDKWYYFDTDGIMQTGFMDLDGKVYYFDNSGAMTFGWKKIGNSWFFFTREGEDAGTIVTGWQKIDGKWYYFSESGVPFMVTGWKTIDGKTYYFDKSGAMHTKWLKFGYYWYYFKSSGEMVTSSVEWKGVTYYFYSDGRCKNP